MLTSANLQQQFLGLGPIQRLCSAGFMGGYSGATISVLHAEAGVFAVRQWPSDAERDRLFALHRLLSWLRDNGLGFIAVPCRTADGRTLIEFAGRLAQVEPWMPGEADFHRRPTNERLANAMEALAAWHRTAARYPAPPGDRRWFDSVPLARSPAVTERLARVQRLTPALLTDHLELARARSASCWHPLLTRLAEGIIATCARVERMLAEHIAEMVPLLPCLRDVWHDHVLFVDEHVTGLIDASACRTECVAADLARLLGSLVEDDVAAWQAGLVAYERRRLLSDAERRLIPVLDRSGVVLSAATWMEWLGPQNRRVWDSARVKDRLERLSRRLERFASTRPPRLIVDS